MSNSITLKPGFLKRQILRAVKENRYTRLHFARECFNKDYNHSLNLNSEEEYAKCFGIDHEREQHARMRNTNNA